MGALFDDLASNLLKRVAFYLESRHLLMETNPVWHLGHVVVGHCKHVQISQVESDRYWDLSDLVVANVEHFKLLELWSTQLSDLEQSILVEMELREPRQVFADGWNLTQLIAVKAEVAEIFHVDLRWIDLLT